VLLCSASKKREWIIPKGGWEQDEDERSCAIRESYEEAGVFGRLGEEICEVRFSSKKKGGQGAGTECVLRAYVLYVEEVLQDWPESGRARKVISIDEALEEVKRPELLEVLQEVKRRGLNNKC